MLVAGTPGGHASRQTVISVLSSNAYETVTAPDWWTKPAGIRQCNA